MTFDIERARALAAELGYWPATTNPEDLERYERQIAAHGARSEKDAEGRYILVRPPLTPADAVLRDTITELSVHAPCGKLRGPVYKHYTHWWQSCPHEDAPQKWAGCDVSREYDLCVICARGTAGGTSRWSWIACEHCRAVNNSLTPVLGYKPFALGRHSLMNGVGVRGGAPRAEQDRQADRLLEFSRHHHKLWEWHKTEYSRLAVVFDPEADVPLRVWQERHPPGRQASVDVITQMLGGDTEG
jgi:hypothetical protein